jgi:polyhydroxyalkanoate synthesis regulator phasin
MGREPLGPPPGRGPIRPDDPTRPVGAPDEPGGPLWPERVEDQLRKLKQLAAVLGLLAALATGLALYALLSDDEDGDGRGASRATVSRLDDRVDRLENRFGDTSEETDVKKLEDDLKDKANKSDVQSLKTEVADLRQAVEQAGQNDQGDDATQAVDQLSSRVDELEQQVEDLEAEQGQQQP